MGGAEIVLIGRLKQYVGGRDRLSVESGQTVPEFLEALGIERRAVSVIIVNGRRVSRDYVLRDGDEVRLLALIGGGSGPLPVEVEGTAGQGNDAPGEVGSA